MPASWQWRAMAASSPAPIMRAGRIGRARDDEPVELARSRAQQIERRLVPLGRARPAVRPARGRARSGCCDRRDSPAPPAPRGRRLERGEKGQDEARRRAGGDDDARGIDRDAVARRDNGAAIACAQRRQAERIGIAEHVASSARRAASRTPLGAGVEGWPTSRCSDIGAGGGALVGRAQHVHDDEGRDPAAPRELQRSSARPFRRQMRG